MTDTAIVSLKEYARSPEIMERFAEVVGKQNAAGYVQSVLLAVSMNNKLAECEPRSIIATALRAAAMRLSCDPGIGHAYPVPFKGKAVLVVGYKGLINMATRTGKYRYINAGPVFEGEAFTEDRITGAASIEGAKKSDKVTGYVASFQLLSGFSKTIYMSVEEIHDLAKKYSKSYNFNDSAWKTNTKDMERKTILRRLISQWGYMDPNDAMMMTTEPGEDVIDGEVYKEIQNLPAPEEVTHVEKPPAPTYEEVFGEPEPQPKSNGKDAVSEEIDVKAYITELAQHCEKPTSKQSQQLAAILEGMLGNSASRYEFMSYLAGKGVKTSKDIPDQRVITALYEWLEPKYDSNGGRFYTENDAAKEAITHAHQEYLKSIGQMELV
ncbi:MAG: recombinase RecT [Saccharofermentanales bacterium]